MSTASLQAKDKSPRALTAKSSPLRRCLVTGEEKEKGTLIRFVLDPADQVTPDLAGRLPGRGLWVSADRANLTLAATQNLFSRSAKTKATVPDNLCDLVETLLKRRCLDLFGLARSAGAAITGMPQIENGLRTSKLSVVLIAQDAGKDSRKKLSYAPLVEAQLTREELGAALGKEHLVAVGLRNLSITEKLLTELVRWHGVKAQ